MYVVPLYFFKISQYTIILTIDQIAGSSWKFFQDIRSFFKSGKHLSISSCFISQKKNTNLFPINSSSASSLLKKIFFRPTQTQSFHTLTSRTQDSSYSPLNVFFTSKTHKRLPKYHIPTEVTGDEITTKTPTSKGILRNLYMFTCLKEQ